MDRLISLIVGAMLVKFISIALLLTHRLNGCRSPRLTLSLRAWAFRISPA